MQQSHNPEYDAMKRQWKAFIEHGELSDQVRPHIAASWKRCREYGVEQTHSPVVLSGAALDQLLFDNGALLSVAHPILEKLMQLAPESMYVITLHNAEGYVLDYLFSNSYKIRQSLGLKVGALWSEKMIGTNGAHLAIIENQAVQVIGPEHYRENQHDGVCVASPIHDATGKIIGCVNMSAQLCNQNLQALALVEASAFAIGRHLSFYHSNKLVEETLRQVNEGILVTDAQLRIVRCSHRAVAILQVSSTKLAQRDIRELLGNNDFEAAVLTDRKSYIYDELSLDPLGRNVPCNVSITPMYQNEYFLGVILQFKETKSINKVVNRVSGNFARYSFHDILTQDKAMLSLMDKIQQVALSDCTILLEGESGVGKELFAHSIHSASRRKNGPFIVVNCAALPRSLVESELFGYEKGSFTGAKNEGSPGKFELANGGTIFLDEVGELPLEIQATLLRVLDTHRITRIGAKTERELDVQIVSATNRNLHEEALNHNFRIDLYFRLNVISFKIPPLRQRKADIILLANKFLNDLNLGDNYFSKQFAPEYIECLIEYSWPGNIRELQNVVVHSFYCSNNRCLSPEDLPDEIRYCKLLPPAESERPPVSLGRPAKVENDYLVTVNAVKCCGGDPVAAAKILGISRATIYRKIKKYQIDLELYKSEVESPTPPSNT